MVQVSTGLVNVKSVKEHMCIYVQRIVEVKYKIPDHTQMSAECKDLISSLLCKDTTKRITLEGIMKHPWFRKNLPEGAANMNRRLQQKTGGQVCCIYYIPSRTIENLIKTILNS